MSVKGYLVLLAVALMQRNLVGDLAGVVEGITGSHQPKARAAQELQVAHLTERRALAGFLLTPGTGETEAAAQGERVRRAIAAVPVPLEEPLSVTASVGAASGADDGWEGLVRRADTGLYAAKEGGRDRVITGPPAGSRSSAREGHDASR